MKVNELSSVSFSFIGDSYYTLKVREHFLSSGYHSGKKLQRICNKYNSAKGQMQCFNKLNQNNFFNEIELEYFKKGRNSINHIPKNGDLISYQIASGFEAIVGFLYLTKDIQRLEKIFEEIFKGEINE